MRYLIVSDSHGYNENVQKAIQQAGPIAGMFHLGDLQCSPGIFETMAGRLVYAVAGNNDYSSELRDECLITVEGKKILMVHGHRQRVYFGIDRLLYLAEERQADVALFGHTHKPYLSEECGIVVCNPGSISLPRQSSRKPTYAIMTIDEDGPIQFTMFELE